MATLGRPPLITDKERLVNLVDVKITEQLSWAALADWYEEQYGEKLHPTTLRRSVMRESPQLLIHERVSKQVKTAIENVWDKVDILRLIMYAFNGRFTEWNILHDQSLRAYMDEEAEPFPTQDKDRMDMLWADMQGFFMRALTVMRDMGVGGGGVAEFELLIKGGSGGVSVDAVGESGRLTPDKIRELVGEVAGKTQEMLENMHTEHQRNGRGYYRQIQEPEEDLMEVDD